MRVELSRAVLEQPAAFRYLTAIAWMFTDGRHRWSVGDSDAIAGSAWLAAEATERRRILAEDAHRASTSEGRAQLYVCAVGAAARWTGGRWEVPADLAEKVLREPLSIVVENAKCDGAFIRIVVLRTGEKRLRRRLGDEVFERLRRSCTNPLGDNEWFAVKHGAGHNTGQQVELVVGAEPTAARRVYVLVDSDRDRPDAPLGATARQVEKTCERLRDGHEARLRLVLRVLRKREVENYLPREALRAYSSGKLASWDALGELGKDHSDLKQLFGKNLWQVMLEERHQGLFHDRALRDRAGRAGRELDELVEDLVSLL